MTEYLADVVMPPPPSSESTANPIADPTEDTEVELASVDIDSDQEGDLPLSEEEEITDKFVEPEKKEKIPQEEIFKSAPKVQPVKEPDLPEKPKKKKRVMTQKQLDALAEARQRGIATRRRKAEEKKRMKELEKEEKQLLKEQKVKRVRKLKEEVAEPKPPQVVEKVVEKDRIVETGYTQSQLDEAVKKAVEESVNKVEVLRKQRKAKKKEVQAKEQHDAKVFKDINSALKNDVWAQCFL